MEDTGVAAAYVFCEEVFLRVLGIPEKSKASTYCRSEIRSSQSGSNFLDFLRLLDSMPVDRN